MVDSCVVSNNLSFKHREYIWNSEEDHDGGCDETYQEAKGRTSWAQSSKQCLKSSIIIAGSQGSPTRVPSGQWHCFCPVHFILQLFCVLRASNTVVGPRHVGLPRENGTGGLFWVRTIYWALLLLHAWYCSYSSYLILEAIWSSGKKQLACHREPRDRDLTETFCIWAPNPGGGFVEGVHRE